MGEAKFMMNKLAGMGRLYVVALFVTLLALVLWSFVDPNNMLRSEGWLMGPTVAMYALWVTATIQTVKSVLEKGRRSLFWVTGLVVGSILTLANAPQTVDALIIIMMICSTIAWIFPGGLILFVIAPKVEK